MFFVILAVLCIVLEKYLTLRVRFHSNSIFSRPILPPNSSRIVCTRFSFSYPLHPRNRRLVASFRGFFVFCVPFWSHRNWESNRTAEIFVCLQLIYLAFSAKQIQFGFVFLCSGPLQIPRAGHARADENRGRRFHARLLLVHRRNSVPRGTQIASSVPFLYEINTLLEWTTARSVLPMNAWFSLEEIHRVLYRALYRVPRFHLSRRRRKPRSRTTSTTARCRGPRGKSCSTAACFSRE